MRPIHLLSIVFLAGSLSASAAVDTGLLALSAAGSEGYHRRRRGARAKL